MNISSTLSPPKGDFSIAWLGIAQICSWGTLYYSFPQIAEAAMAELSWSKADTYGALTLGLLLSAFAGLPFGSAIDKGLGQKVMTYGSVIAGLILLAGSQLTSLWQFYLVFALVGFLHSATLYEAAFSVIANRFDGEQSKHHITTLTLWGGFASTVFIPFIEWLLHVGDWRVAMMVMGLINIIVCGGVYSRLPKVNHDLVNKRIKGKQQTSAGKQSTSPSVSWALKQSIFWWLLISFTLFLAATSAFKFHLYPMFLEKGLDAKEVVIILAIFGPSQVIGRLLLKFFGKDVSMMQLAVALAAVLPVVFLSLAWLPTELWLVIPLAILFGIANGVMTIVKGVAVLEVLSKEAYGAINGAMNVPIKVLKAFAPGLAAVLWSMGGGYQGVLYVLTILGGISVMSFIVIWLKSLKDENSDEGLSSSVS